MSKTNSGLVAYAKAQVGLPYWYGTYGQTADASLYDSRKSQYPDYYTASDFTGQYGKRVHDCTGLIKGYLWSDSATATPTYNSSQDKSSAEMYSAASEKGKISTFPGKAGQLVFRGESTGAIHHVGVYDGNGYVYEAKGHSEGVQKNKYAASDWDYWAQCPYCTDDSGSTSSSSTSNSDSSGSTATLTAGAKVKLSKASLYSSSTASTASGSVSGTYYLWDGTEKNGRVRVTNKKANVGVSDQITGWVNVADLGPDSSGSSATSTTTSKKATDAAQSYDKSLAGTYTVTPSSGLNMRNGAGSGKSIMVALPKGTAVQNYGYYTKAGGVKWLYVQVTYNKVEYTGFCTSEYLKKA